MEYTHEQIENFKMKAEKWDRLKEKIDKYYCNTDGEYDEENPEIQGDLVEIGYEAAVATGWLI